MDLKRAIETLQLFREGSSEITPDELDEALVIAINQIGKRIPKEPIRKEWSPNRCPTCNEDLGGHCDDGYYDNPRLDVCPACGQMLNYD